MAQTIKCVVRPLVGDKTLDGDGDSHRDTASAANPTTGAFRLHLPPELLDTAGLKTGELCEISSENNTTLGYGLAWRATERMGGSNPAVKPVRLTQTFRDLLKLSEGTHVSLRRTDAKLSPATKVITEDVTPQDYPMASETVIGKGVWRIRALYSLASHEAFVKGFEFDSGTTKRRKRFRVVDVQGQTGGLDIHCCDDDTDLVIADARVNPPGPMDTTLQSGQLLDPECFGGLSEQLQELNEAMEAVLYQHQDPVNRETGGQFNEGVMVHGYEGTGKSHIIEQLQRLKPFKRILKISPPSLPTAPGRYHEIIRNTFREAETNQPSLILIDDCNVVVPPSDRGNTDLITSELDRLAHQRVLVIATCRDITDVNPMLLESGRLPIRIELPAPDSVARSIILRILLPKTNEQQSLADEVATHTHGFTGKDLKMLVRQAHRSLRKRYRDEPKRYTLIQEGTNGYVGDADHPSQQFVQEQSRETSEPPSYVIEDFEIAITKVRPTALREVIFERPKIGWKDIGGSGAIQDRFYKALGWPLHHTQIMAKWRLQPQKGILLYGPPGCSKTLTAQAVASHYQQNFITVKGAELTSMYVGESERAIREIFRKARQAAPCVVFFDEIDAIASERETGGSKGLNIVTTLLTEMDGFVPLNGVLVLAATNKPEILDPAIMRPGRFGTHIYIGPPNAAARKEIFEIRLAGLPVDASVDIDDLVEDTEGYSGAEITQICALAVEDGAGREIAGSAELLCMPDLKNALAQTRKSITSDMLASYHAFAAG